MTDSGVLNPDTKTEDAALIQQILGGSRPALEMLIGRYQGWIYNVALKMTMDPRDAEDVSQEVLVKLITKLATYDPEKGLFRTWLYRVTANHVLNMKTRKYERVFSSMEAGAEAIEQVPDESMEASPEQRLLVEELKIKCMTGVLLCLDRRHRLVFIMSEIFDVSHAEGKEILDVSDAGYRKMLSRARRKVYSFINQNCGLIDPGNPCHCRKKLKGLIRAGFIDPDRLTFYRDKVSTIAEAVKQHRGALAHMCTTDKARALFQNHPFYDPPNLDEQIGRTLQCATINTLM